MAASRSPRTRVVVSEAAATRSTDANTTFVQADPATFRALVQKLTGAPPADENQHYPRQEAVPVVAQAPAPRRPKLQERRRRAAPPRLELARQRQSFYYCHHHGLTHSPVSPMDAYVLASSSSSSPSTLSSSSSSMSPSPRAVVISKEEEEREEKAIASKAFYLHSSSTSGGDGERPKLLPLFPVYSPTRSSSFAS